MNRNVKMRMMTALAIITVATVSLWATPSKEAEYAAAATGVPKYGGTFAVVLRNDDPPTPAIKDANFGSLYWLEMMQEHPMAGDFVKYGPRGSNVYKFQSFGYVPEQYLKGHLLESWEVTHEKLVWRVRPGISWAPTADQMKRGVMAKPRELTAQDMADDVIRFMNCGWRTRFEGIATVDNVRVLDKYTMEITFIKFSPMLNYYIGMEDRSIYSPPETETAGADKWENQIGTG